MVERTEREKGAHLLRRFGLGASEAELDYYLKDGLKGAIDKLLNYEDTDENFGVDIARFNRNDKLQIQGALQWWTLRLLGTRRPLQEKMTVFWHDHFATSASKVNVPALMVQQNEILRSNATGKFEPMLLELSKDPAMLFWLDNNVNVKGKPNENFAREVMELFTLGIGNYTEKDIQEAARAFTGWTFRARNRPNEAPKPGPFAEFLYRPFLHDSSEKTVFGKTGDFNGEDIVKMLCAMPQTPKHLTKKIWEWFVYRDPEDSVIDKHATKFRDSGLDIKVLLRSIMESSEFYSDKAIRAIVKTPLDFCVTTLRQLGVGEQIMARVKESGDGELPRPALGVMSATSIAMKNMGMQLFFPPDVAGWDGGNAWISSATMVSRIQWADQMFERPSGGAGRDRPAAGAKPAVRGRINMTLPVSGFIDLGISNGDLVMKVCSMFDIVLPGDKMQQLADTAASVCGAKVQNYAAAQDAVAAVARLVFGSPEFQFC